MRFLRGLSVAISVGLFTPPVSAQTPGPARTGFPDQLRYLLAQAGSGFTEIRGDSIGPDAWRGRYRLVAELEGTDSGFSFASAIFVFAIRTPCPVSRHRRP